ncbi:MAG TPA: hypothetical protein VHE82_04480 [Gemmatimonadaceae bacterium]|nr:hypothetical protein [Gemmatimonadaceae bacterium]
MSCARATARDIGRWFVFSSVIVSLGCARETQMSPPDPSNPLPTGVEHKGPDFLKQIAPSTAINAHERDRTAKSFFPSKTKVLIEALGNTYDINPNSPPNTGRPVAHLVNRGEKTEKHYGLLPQAEAEYYLWVDAKSATQAQWTLLELSHATDSVYAGLPQDLNYCHKYMGGKPVSDADFAEYRKDGACDVPITEPSPKVSQASLIPTSAFVALLEHAFAFLAAYAKTDGGWIYCYNGCCT